MQNNVNTLSILLSSKCNLNCEFCFFKKNDFFNQFNEQVKKEWENHTYISTILKTLKKINQYPENITSINFWGGETLYNLEPFISNIHELLINFPNINELWLPTNFSININQLVQLIKELDNNLQKKTNMQLQLSIDGPIDIAGHKILYETYEENINNFFNQINCIELKKLFIRITINSVIEEKKYLNYFSNNENILIYFSYMNNLCNLIKNKNKNKNILFNKEINIPTPSSPSEATTQNGIDFANILKNQHQILKNNFPNIKPNMFSHILRGKNQYIISFPNFECKQLLTNICILPDGTIAECINHFLLHDLNYQHQLLEQNDFETINTSIYSSALAYNPNKINNYNKLKEHCRYIQKGFRNNYTTYQCLSMATCLELLASHQIDDSYKDLEKLFKHINFFEKEFGCSSYNHQTTHIPYMSSPGNYRKIFNGVADYIIQNNIKDKNNL